MKKFGYLYSDDDISHIAFFEQKLQNFFIYMLHYKITIYREVTTSALTGFHASPSSWSNWNLEVLVSLEGRKPEKPRKILVAWRKPVTNSTAYGTGFGRICGSQALSPTVAIPTP